MNSPEIRDIVLFLSQQHPFNALPPNAIQQAASVLEISYHPKNRAVLAIGETNNTLFIVRQGATDVTDGQGILVERCGEGDIFGFPSLLTTGVAAYAVTTIEDSLLYRLPAEIFHQLRHTYPAFDRYFIEAHGNRLQAANSSKQADSSLLTGHVGRLVQRQPITIQADFSIHAAAQRMNQERVSSLLVIQEESLIGIITDRDIRNRVVAKRLDYDTPIAQVMTPNPLIIQAEQQIAEAHLLMSHHNIHHLPVLDGDKLIGLITTTDLMRLQASSPVHMIGEIAKQNSPAAIARVLAHLPMLILRLIDADSTAYDIGHVVTMVTDAVTRRNLELAEATLGAPPVPYTWLAFGSQARQEQTARTDQDNGLLLSDDATPEDLEYFSALAKQVTDGLALCGYDYCPGGVMATNWKLTWSQWNETFRQWINFPDPEALLNATIFFDMRPIYGDMTLAETLHNTVLETAQGNMGFLGNLAKNALGFHPPLGFFRRFVLEKEGEHQNTLNLKQRGITPIIDLTRVYALTHAIQAVNTSDRLTALIPTPALVAADAANLRDTLEYIAYVRLQHQGQQIAAGEEPDNFVDPDALSGFERQQLKTAFTIVRSMQNTLSQRYLTALMG